MVKNTEVQKAKEIIKELTKEGYEAYLVGGYVRDKLLGIDSYDADVATSADYTTVRKILGKKMAIEEVGANFAVLIANGIEVASFRKDEYNGSGDGKPSVSHVGTLEDDAGRRDFTINALYMGIDGKIIDKYGGQMDIKNKVIRCVGDADARFKEDGSRILRAIYLASKLGFSIDKETVKSMKRNKGLLATKVPNELKGKILRKAMKTSLSRFLNLTMELGLMDYIIPELSHLKNLPQNPKYHVYDKDAFGHVLATVRYMDKHHQGNEEYLLAMMLHDVAKGIEGVRSEDAKGVHDFRHEEIGAKISRKVLRRLNFGSETVTTVENLVKYHGVRIGINNSFIDIDKVLKKVSKAVGTKEELDKFMQKLLEVMKADADSFSKDLKEDALDYITKVSGMYKDGLEKNNYYLKDTGIDGRYVMEMNPTLKGKDVGLMLQVILDRKLEKMTDIDAIILRGVKETRGQEQKENSKRRKEKEVDKAYTKISENFNDGVQKKIQKLKNGNVIKIFGIYDI